MVTPRPWTLLLFRTVVTVEAVLGALQPFLAGGFLSGNYGMLDLHALNASAVGTVCLVQIGAAVLLWRPGGGPAWPAQASATLFLAEAMQIALGYARNLAIHIPLGTAIIGCLVAMLVWSWRTAPAVDVVEESL